jgi:AraC-like DNA-binding protein
MDIRNIWHFEGDHTSWNHPNTVRPWNSLYFVLAGDGFIGTSEKVMSLKAGHTYLMPLNVMIDLGCTTKIEKVYLDFSVTLESGQDIFSQLNEPLDVGRFSDKVMKFVDTDVRTSPHLQMMSMSCLLDVMTSEKLIPCIDEAMMHEQRVMSKHSEVFKYLQEHLSASMKINELAEEMGQSVPSLSRSFKRETGYNLKALIQSKINEKAQALLISTEKNIQEIAYECGFEYADYFCRFFKRNNQCTPKEYRLARRHEV